MNERKETLKKPEGPKAHTEANIISLGYPLNALLAQNSKNSESYRVGEKGEKVFPQKTFRTKPKLRRLTFHKQPTVRNRVHALQKSFYPTKEVPYQAVRRRMATLLGICDRASVLAYLGRPQHRTSHVVSHVKRWNKTGNSTPITHYFQKKLKARKGYIEIFGLGYVYIRKPTLDLGEWWVHWNHTEQLTLPKLGNGESSPKSPLKQESVDEGLDIEVVGDSEKVSEEVFSLSYKSKHGTRKDECEHSSREIERRERDVIGERNSATESIHRFHGKDHSEKVKVNQNFPTPLRNLTPQEKAILRISKKGDAHG